jgi:hypothetical protein
VKVSFVVECRDRTEFTLVLPGISFAGVGVKKEDMLQRDEKYTVALDFKVPDVSEEIFSEEFGVEHGEFYVAKLTGVVLFQVAECIVAPNIDSMRAVVSQLSNDVTVAGWDEFPVFTIVNEHAVAVPQVDPG